MAADTTDVDRVRATVEAMKDAPAPGWVWENGRGWTTALERVVVDDGRRTELFVEADAPEDVRDAVREFARDWWPEIGQCYKNALRFADVTGAEYVEGYALLGDGSGIAQSHAWNRLDSHIVDVTSTWTAAYGARVSEEHSEAALELGEKDGWWGVVFNEVYYGLP